MKARVRWRKSSISGGRVKSMPASLIAVAVTTGYFISRTPKRQAHGQFYSSFRGNRRRADRACRRLLMLFTGRIAGVSGIFRRPHQPQSDDRAWRAAFIAGLVAAPLSVMLLGYQVPLPQMPGSFATIVGGGLLVGFGTRLGSGCTSGHGICGIARISPRSIAATCTFMRRRSGGRADPSRVRRLNHAGPGKSALRVRVRLGTDDLRYIQPARF